MSYMQVVLVGNLGRDVNLRFTPSGEAVADFSLAVNRKWTDQRTQEKKEETTWFKISVFGAQAESCGQHLRKGSQCLVAANRIKADTYVGQDGQARVNLEVVAREVRFLDSGGGQPQQHQEPQYEHIDDVPF